MTLTALLALQLETASLVITKSLLYLQPIKWKYLLAQHVLLKHVLQTVPLVSTILHQQKRNVKLVLQHTLWTLHLELVSSLNAHQTNSIIKQLHHVKTVHQHVLLVLMLLLVWLAQLALISITDYVKSHALQDLLQATIQENVSLVQLTVLHVQWIQMTPLLVLNVLILTSCIDNSVPRVAQLDSIKTLNSNGVLNADVIALLAQLMMFVTLALESLHLKVLEFVQFNTDKMLLQYLL